MKKKFRRNELTKLLQEFKENGKISCDTYAKIREEVLEFNASLESSERSMVHSISGELGLYHWSCGIGDQRHISVSKNAPPEDDDDICSFPLPKAQDAFRIPVDTWRYREEGKTNEHKYKDTVNNLIRTAPTSYTFNYINGSNGTKSRQLKVITTIESLHEMAKDLVCVNEIAVDLEANNKRSYDGICCLLQIATRQVDYVIDAIALHDDLAPLLASTVFANERILKVFHSCESLDIPSLHRDFGCYIVNCFDTQLAAACLCGQYLSLINCYRAFGVVSNPILEQHTDLKAQYQNCDWLVRPLSHEHIQYARLDVAYLLELKDAIVKVLSAPGRYDLILQTDDNFAFKDDLDNDDLDWDDNEEDNADFRLPISPNLDEEADALRHAWCRSQRASLRIWQPKPRPEPKIARQDKAFKRHRTSLGYRESVCFYLLYIWRDNLARKFDESAYSLCSSEILIKFARHLPMNANELRRVFYPLPPVVRCDMQNLLSLIRKAAFCEYSSHDFLLGQQHCSSNDELSPLASWYVFLRSQRIW
uniref:HRDC domain-containing protein n=1 Tax=Aureoumbra lagunensis TaxID=44058 RepID=A0A7S3JU01_9STRA|mmetsp:Transcript_1774/g.2711  ORF Transcript_1774/g.2711 Transcript_1774/m.2711 type:complete len:535 (-) Transcript_1774:1009-2613(-)